MIFRAKTMYFFLLVLVSLANGENVVMTENGPIKGISLKEKNVMAFLGVPYAKPPLGPLRFAKTVPASPWEEIYDANKLPPACIQADVGKFHFSADPKMDEDCLYLNLWVPEGGVGPKPIMVWIHGGAFMTGSTNMKLYDGANLAQGGDIIVASINFRVGTLGFFTSFTDEAPGNMGMFDQLMAIQWIKDNAKHFGGDPDNILLFGQNSGACSVSLHMISPLSQNLFKRGILQSGSSFSPLYSNNNLMLSVGSEFAARVLGCADDDTSLETNPKSVVDCMQTIPPEKISQADLTLKKNNVYVLPRVGDDFLPQTSIELFRNGQFKDTEVLFGITRNEGNFLVVLMNREKLGRLGDKIDPTFVNETFAKELIKPLELLHYGNQTYFERVKEDTGYTYLDAASDFVGDFLITCGAIFQADYLSLKTPSVYFYVFDYRPSSTPFAEWMGVTPTTEIQYVFGNQIHGPFTEFEEEFSKDMMNIWVTFAKTGNPGVPGGLKWPPYSFGDPKYVTIGKTQTVGVRPDDYRCEYWREYFRSVIDEEAI